MTVVWLCFKTKNQILQCKICMKSYLPSLVKVNHTLSITLKQRRWRFINYSVQRHLKHSRGYLIQRHENNLRGILPLSWSPETHELKHNSYQHISFTCIFAYPRCATKKHCRWLYTLANWQLIPAWPVATGPLRQHLCS